jgi:phosphopantothenoylcysteine decarboxylase/phosphopantothenate--cysteine ligase
MARILITSGPTRQYLDPVRYLTNASSGRMGLALVEAVRQLGHEAVVVSGPVDVEYPDGVDVRRVISTDEMLAAAREAFADCDGLIGAAAPCDYQPIKVADNKINKTGRPLVLELVETADVVATLAADKGKRWAVGFALETEDQRLRALAKLERKCCDLMVVNGPEAMNSLDNNVEMMDAAGEVIGAFSGSKQDVAREILGVIDRLLIKNCQ